MSKEKIISGKIDLLLKKYPEIQKTSISGKIRDRNKNDIEKIKINKEAYESIKDLWMLLNQKYTLQYDEEVDVSICDALPKLILESLTEITISSVRSEVKAENGMMIVADGGSVPYVIKKKMKLLLL